MYERPLRSDELCHFGVKGMHWGVRRYQNADGSLTSAGKARYLDSSGGLTKYGKSRVRSLERRNRSLATRARKTMAKSDSRYREAYKVTEKYMIPSLHPVANTKSHLMRKRADKLYRQAQSYGDVIKKNKRMIDALNTPISEVYKKDQ